MSSSPLKSFNLGGNYPFLDHTKSAMPTPPPPSPYAQGVPSTHFNYPQKTQTPSPPGSHPSSPVSAPMPQYPPAQMSPSYSTSSASTTSSASGSRGIFTLYRPDGATTPELEDILSTKKKPTWSGK